VTLLIHSWHHFYLFFWVTTTTGDHPSLTANVSGGVFDFLGDYSYHHPLAHSKHKQRGVLVFHSRHQLPPPPLSPQTQGGALPHPLTVTTPSVASNVRRGLVLSTNNHHPPPPPITSNVSGGFVLSTDSHHPPSIASNTRRGFVLSSYSHYQPLPPPAASNASRGLSHPLMATTTTPHRLKHEWGVCLVH
jgi:hypothetical protein